MIKFGDIYAEPVRNGLTRPTKVRGSGYRMVNMGELFAYDRINGQPMELVPLNERELRVATLEVGDLLFARSSLKIEGTGKCSIVAGVPDITTFESHLIRARLDQSKADPRFYFYFFQSHYGRTTVLSIAKQVGAAGLPGSQLATLSVPSPPIQKQSAIADILWRYDELIGNNARRIKLLEDAARLLYEEWFVRLRFPGHEHTPVCDGVPEGWERKLIANVCDTIGGGTPSTKVPEYWEGDITWVVPSDVTKNDCLALLDSERKITEKGLRESSAKMVPAETILMTSRASVGFFALMDHEVCTNQGFINIIPHEEPMRMYLLFNLMNRVEEIRSNAKGTTYPEISKGRFRGMDVVVPSEPLVNAFSDFATGIVRQVRCLKKQAVGLQRARDLLLPRLMSGEVAV
ncbi:MAG: restriction endonuclease subunit S [Phycisphaeraceae bacterium]|nr:restriction endonuclease subunit S [Phycisphaeraceae bacterium]